MQNFLQKLKTFWQAQTSTLVRKFFVYSLIATIVLLILSVATGVDVLFSLTKGVAIVCVLSSLVVTAGKYRAFKGKIDGQRRDRLRERGIEEADDMGKRELRKQKIFHEQEKSWIKRKQREFKLTIFLRVCIIILLIVMLFNLLVIPI